MVITKQTERRPGSRAESRDSIRKAPVRHNPRNPPGVTPAVALPKDDGRKRVMSLLKEAIKEVKKL
jgi:hypothetical protein